MIDGRSLFRILDFFFPIDIVSAVVAGGLAVFAVENILDSFVTQHVPDPYVNLFWAAIAIVGIVSLSMLNLLSADEDEIDELEDDIEDLVNGYQNV